MPRPLLPALALAACTPRAELPFPEGFAWGTATAGFQVDMGCPTWSDAQCLDTASDWYQWVNDPEVIADPAMFTTGDDVRGGPGMWELWEEDVAAMAAARLDTYRFSIEWSRLFPDAAAAEATTVDALVPLADADALARYHEQLDALAAAGVAPLVSLNHQSLPLWVHDGVACRADPDCEAAGWVDPRTPARIALFAGFCARVFGDRVDLWATLNEPFANTLAGYVQPGEFRVHPPGRAFDGPAAVASIVHQIEAHAQMFDAVHAAVGVVLNMVAAEPIDPDNPASVEATAHLDYVYHRIFLDALTAGAWDDDVDGLVDRTRPELADRLDWIGINYYNRVRVGSLGSIRPLPEVPILDFLPEIQEEPFPEGIASVVAIAAEYERPIWITENGTAFPEWRVRNLEETLATLHASVEGGADVRGYLYWSWVDNYEWNHGFDMQFGLHAVDPVTKARSPRPVMARYAEVARANGP
jgi:beta-glucosidase/6-phospho-beta-glucosidase/beta-galactosidase